MTVSATTSPTILERTRALLPELRDGALASEQARWTDLNQRMEALEAALGPR